MVTLSQGAARTVVETPVAIGDPIAPAGDPVKDSKHRRAGEKAAALLLVHILQIRIPVQALFVKPQ